VPLLRHKALIKLFGLPEEKIRVIQTETGGGFGGKEEYPSLIAGHAALLSWKSGLPVKMIYDRAEDMVATTKRHPSHTRHKTAVTKDGKLLAMEIDFVIDGGAYCTLSPVGAFARHDSRRRSLLLSERTHQEHRGRYQHAAARGLQRIWGAAEHLRARTAHGQSGGRAWLNSGRISATKFYQGRRNDCDESGYSGEC
jgi:hypothetical protein